MRAPATSQHDKVLFYFMHIGPMRPLANQRLQPLIPLHSKKWRNHIGTALRVVQLLPETLEPGWMTPAMASGLTNQCLDDRRTVDGSSLERQLITTRIMAVNNGHLHSRHVLFRTLDASDRDIGRIRCVVRCPIRQEASTRLIRQHPVGTVPNC